MRPLCILVDAVDVGQLDTVEQWFSQVKSNLLILSF